MKEEEQLDAFLAKSKEPPASAPNNDTPQEEQIVEQKARQAKQPLRSTVLQRKNVLDEQSIERNIATTLRKHPDLDETKLREAIAKRLEDQNDELSEADYAQIVNGLLKQKETIENSEKQAAVEPPPAAAAIAQGTAEQVNRLADWASGLQTPGGIGLLVGVIVFMVWVIVPINAQGKTRMQLLWGILTGQVEMAPMDQDAGGGQGADFGTSTGEPGGQGIDFANARQFVPSTITYLPSFEVF